MDVLRLLMSAATPYGFLLAYSPRHYLAAIAAILAGGVFVALVSPPLRRAPRWVQYIASFLLLGTLVLVADELRKSNDGMLPALMRVWNPARQMVGLSGMVVGALIVAALAARYLIPIARLYRRVLLALSVFALFAIVKLLWLTTTMDFAFFHLTPRPTHPGLPSAHRVVIVVFDEMDNEIAFTKRPTTLSLPHFDSMRATAVVFDSAYSPAPNTMESMSSLLLGRRVDSLVPLTANSFLARLAGGGQLHSDSASSIFSALAAVGARTALVGFAIPYCRIGIVKMVDRCEKIPLVGGGALDVEKEGFWQTVAEQIQSLLPFNGRRWHIARLREVIDTATAYAADSSYSLVLLHLPLPHTPWIWDRNGNQYRVNITGDDGYLGNLALADRVLGQMQDAMIQHGTWDGTTLIVTADHPWREKIKGGRSSDSRIPLMIKLPGMQKGENVTAPTNSLVVSTLVPSFVDAQITTPASLRDRVAEIMSTERTLQRNPSP